MSEKLIAKSEHGGYNLEIKKKDGRPPQDDGTLVLPGKPVTYNLYLNGHLAAHSYEADNVICHLTALIDKFTHVLSACGWKYDPNRPIDLTNLDLIVALRGRSVWEFNSTSGNLMVYANNHVRSVNDVLQRYDVYVNGRLTKTELDRDALIQQLATYGAGVVISFIGEVLKLP